MAASRYIPSVKKSLTIFCTFLVSGILIHIFDLHLLSLPKNLPWYTSTAAPTWGGSSFDSGLYFPAEGSNFLPTVAPYNLPPEDRPNTPLFIPFTRNNAMLRQTVLGYIASGWPREDIIIVDNSGTLDANNRKLLSKSNPFFLDYDLFRRRYGVSILQTPVLLNFAQLQNFMLRMALDRNWPYYFWSHMDIGILSREDATPYKSFYQRVIEIMAEAGLNKTTDRAKWGVKMFHFDNLALMNVAAWRQAGQWDVFVPYYTADCDAYSRLRMFGYTLDDVDAGYIWDLADYVKDPEARFFPPPSLKNSTIGSLTGFSRFRKGGNDDDDDDDDEQGPNSARFKSLYDAFDKLQNAKGSNSKGRNTWQNMQIGGKGEPWTYDPAGFQAAWWQTAEAGRQLFEKKWGTLNCDLLAEKKTIRDMWKGVKEVTS